MSYSNISDVGNAIIRILREELVPDLVRKEDSIALASPGNKGDLNVCVYLYDIRENDDVRMHGMQTTGLHRQQFPKSYLDLYYMITVYSESELKFRALEEQKLLGRIYQVLRDVPVIPMAKLTDLKDTPDLGIHIEYLKMELQEKMKIWPLNDKPYQVSLFYRVYPIGIESMRQRDISRVMDIDFTIQEE